MALPNWWQITIPHRDIQEGKLNEAIFAADLGDVVVGTAPVEYKDAQLFFQKTYLTRGLENLLNTVFSRLSGGKGDPVIQLQTPFGGGKTHALLTLYHCVKHREKISHLPVASKLANVHNAKVAVFVGTHADALSGKTPWGEIAEQLGQYEVVKEHDQKRIAPGKETFRKVLENAGPTLILMDELLEYVVKANRAEKLEKITQGQTFAFLQELSELITSMENCCLVITLPASILESYDEEAEKTLQQLQKISGRVEAVYSPVEGVEIYEVIRKRLFENLGDERIRKEVAQSYFDLYQKLGTDIPSEAKEIEYRERIEHSYPFHPELIDVLYERWGSFPTFQRTRGVLRLLAEIVADLYNRKIPSPLIQSSLVNLENQAIRREFIKHIGNEFESVIAADIAGKNAKAPKIDKDMGSEYATYGIATGIATSVFLYSFSGAARKETTLPRIRIALLREGIPSTIVGDAIGKLEEELWYFHSEKKQYAFRNQPNLNRVIVDKEETISDLRIKEKLYESIQSNCGKAFDVYLWPEIASDIPDNKSLKLVLLSPEYAYNPEESNKRASEFFEKAGTGFRVYKNTLFVLALESAQYLNLSKSLKRFLAILEIQSDTKLTNTLPKESQDELKSKLKELEKEIPFKILTAYRHLAIVDTHGIAWKDLGIPTVGTNLTISERVKQYLKDQEKILSRLSPKYIIEKAFAKDENEKELSNIYELFLKTPGMPLLENENVLYSTIQEGVKNGLLALKKDKEIYYKQDIQPSMDSIILRAELVEAENIQKATLKPENLRYETQLAQNSHVEEAKSAAIEPKEGNVVRNIFIRAKIPWDKISSIISGVIIPLKDKSSSLEIFIEVKAKSTEGFDRMTLDNKVKETLKQINSEIEKWDEQ